MCGNGGIGHTQKALGNDCSYFEAVEVLVPHLRQNSFQRVLDLFRSESAKEHHLYFCRHEKKVPARSVDLAIKGETIEGFDHAPIPRAGLALQPKELGYQRPIFDENRSDFNGWRHKSSRETR